MKLSTFRRLIENVPPSMLIRGYLYPYQRAYRVTRAVRPELKGFPFWKNVIKEAHQRILSPPPGSELFSDPGNVAGTFRDGGSIILKLTEGSVKFDALDGNMIRLQVSPDGEFPETGSYSIEKPPEQWVRPGLEMKEDGEIIRISSAGISLGISRNPFTFSVKKPGGGTLLRGGSAAFRMWQGRFDENTAFYGLGEKAAGLNLSGKQFELLNTDPAGYNRGDDPIYLSVPFFTALSREGSLGLFFDNSYHSWFDFGRTSPGRCTYKTAGGRLCLYLITGTPEEIIREYTELTGRTRMLPLWALGFHQCRWSYYPEARVDRIAKEFRERKLPCDGIHIDIHYMDGYRCFTWNRDRFPDPPGLVKRLQSRGFKVLTILDPGLKEDKGYRIFKDGKDKNVFMTYPDGRPYTGPVWPGRCQFPDYSSSRVRSWWGNLYKILLDDGVDAFWNDMNEAAVITNRPGRTNFVPDEVVHHGDYGTTDHAEIHNLYGMLMARASREGLDKLRPHKRTLLMTRSGWAGVQRYATHWTGDNGSTWDHLLLSVQMCLNLGMSGIPVTGPDIGGFSGTCTPELFARWMEAGVFMPFYRAHTWFGAPDQEPWTFGKEVEDISRKYLELRYSMLPVVYTALWQAARYGTPMMRPMSFVYPEDPATYSLDDQFMFGDSILAAPVVEEGARDRSVYLPEGAWIDFWTRRKLAGPGSITVDSPLDHLPIYIKAGSAVPRWPVQQYVGEQVIEMTEIDVYPGTGTVTSRLYQDDGTDPAAHLSENHLLSEFVYQNNAGEISFSRVIKSGTFKDVPRRWKLKLISVDKSLKSVPVFGISGLDQEYSRASGTLDVYFETAKDFEIRLG